MHPTIKFIWRTIIAGVLFLVPLIVLIVVTTQAVRLLAKMLNPVARQLPWQSPLGVASADLLAILLLLVIGFAAGLVAQLGFAARLNRTLERFILSKLPGYTLFKSVAQGAAGEGETDLKVALANIDDAWLISFIVEEHADGFLTVFVPSAPSPTAGTVYFLSEKQVKRLDVPVSAAVKCISRLGVGSRELLAGKVTLQ